MKKLLSFIFLLVSFHHAVSQMSRGDSLLKNWDRQFANYPYLVKKNELLSIIARLQKDKDRTSLSNAYRRLGITEVERGKLEPALEAYLESLKYLEGNENAASRGSTYNSIAEVYFQMDNMELATDYMRQALVSYKEAGYREGLYLVNSNLSSIYEYAGDTVNATKYFKESLLYFSGDPAELPYQWNLLGLKEYNLGNFDEANYWFYKAFRDSVTMDDQVLVSTLYANIGNCYKETGQEDSAGLFYSRALETGFISEDPVVISRAAGLLSRHFERLGDTVQAYAYLKTYTIFNDSLLSEAKIESMIDAEQRYQNKVKSAEIENQQTRIRQREIIGWILGAFLLLSLGFIFMLSKYNRQKQRLAHSEIEKRDFEINELLQKQEIKSLNAQMLGQDEERQRIARDLHDRLGSLLSTIKINFSNIETEMQDIRQRQDQAYGKLLGLVDEAYNEVRKISHDLSSGVLEKFGFKTALQELIAAIESSSKLKIKFIDNNLDTAEYIPIQEPLYRITQELLGNTLKYAGASEVNIQIQLHEGVFYYTYEDDGRGFDKQKLAAAKGIGYRNIEKRVQMMNGTWNLDTTPGHGMTLVVEIPV